MEGRKARCESQSGGGEGGREGEIEITTDRPERARQPLIPSVRCSGRACNGALTPSSSLLTSCLGPSRSTDPMKSYLRSEFGQYRS